ncbi:Uma2 family endonuclease [Sporosarcina sp. Marseille-Q4943]|uniref:Uma2 family endonuclease n=1 Tax=Sporosarcina sp. Marseille-Q4943 TaxID=2942204 RepID=UPI00208DCE24|nr:Uma2 family endonuclease [Sporosarcina sp. Marseille-Q4943]
MAQTETNRRYTIADICGWDGRWELIDGIPYNMTPAPSTAHQQIVGELFFALRSHFGKSGCSVFIAPFDVQLEESDQHTIVQPDLSVFCKEQTIHSNRAIGVADLLVEVLSPSTALKDRNEKFILYERSGVKEYWLVDPLNHTIELYGLSDGRYSRRKVFGVDDTLNSFVFPELSIDMKNILRG